MACPHEQCGLSQCGHFANKGGGGVNFSRLCAEVFYGRPLSETIRIINFMPQVAMGRM